MPRQWRDSTNDENWLVGLLRYFRTNLNAPFLLNRHALPRAVMSACTTRQAVILARSW
jgi:hypothetical protein